MGSFLLINHGPNCRDNALFYCYIQIKEQVLAKEEETIITYSPEGAALVEEQKQKQKQFTIGNTSKILEYNYNWPYDFFSLVELVQLEPEMVYKGRVTDNDE